jgi:two-component system nitrate/nitrite response regulator NarL
MIRLMVVDDHEPSREQAIRELSTPGVIQIIAQAETSDEAWKTAQKLLPDMVLLDLHLPGLLNTYDLLKRLISLPRNQVVIFASDSKASEVQDLLDAGAAAYVLKTDPPALIRMAMLMVSRGSRGIVSPSLPRHLTKLTPNERAILRHLTKKSKPGQIAERLGLSEAELLEVMTHLTQKLELDSTVHLVKWAKKHGF